MKLNFKGFFKAAGLFPLALMLSGCISYALVSHTAKGSSGKYQSVLTPKSWTVKHEAYRSDSDIQLESDLLISG